MNGLKTYMLKIASAAAVAIFASTVVAVTPAQASGSVIDIGFTINDNGVIRGSGSTTNNGDYTNICVVIMFDDTQPGVSNASQTCRSERGSYSWNAPGVPIANWLVYGQCAQWYTRITAYRNGTRVANKNSNVIGVCNQ